MKANTYRTLTLLLATLLAISKQYPACFRERCNTISVINSIRSTKSESELSKILTDFKEKDCDLYIYDALRLLGKIAKESSNIDLKIIKDLILSKTNTQENYFSLIDFYFSQLKSQHRVYHDIDTHYSISKVFYEKKCDTKKTIEEFVTLCKKSFVHSTDF